MINWRKGGRDPYPRKGARKEGEEQGTLGGRVQTINGTACIEGEGRGGAMERGRGGVNTPDPTIPLIVTDKRKKEQSKV